MEGMLACGTEGKLGEMREESRGQTTLQKDNGQRTKSLFNSLCC